MDIAMIVLVLVALAVALSIVRPSLPFPTSEPTDRDHQRLMAELWAHRE